MKKKQYPLQLFQFCAILLLVFVFCAAANARTQQADICLQRGDVDLNGSVTASDARLALRQSVMLENFSDAEILRASFYEEGRVTAADARQILRIAVKLDPQPTHIAVTDARTDPTCAAPGKTEGTHCCVCGEVIVAQEKIPALPHTLKITPETPATCTEGGITESSVCTVCGTVIAEAKPISPLGHDLVKHDAKAPTCTEIGWDAYETCSRCDYTTYKEKAALGHDVVKHNAKAATCTEIGWDAYETCSRCDYTTYKEKAALGHDIVKHDAKAPTCTEIGWDAYETCSRCDYSTYKEKAALGHDIVKHDAKAPTCTEIGWDAYETCSRCDYTTYQEKAALGHDVVKHDAKAATCTEIGWDAYETCSRCDYTTYQEKAALGHDLVKHDAKAPTCTEIGWDAYETCSRCDFTTYQEKAALGHDIVKHDANAPTCTEIGWDAYETCSRCDYTTYQEKAALGHDVVKHDAKAPTCTEIGWDAYETCSRCDYSTYKEKAALGHDIVKHDAKAPTCTEIGWEAYETCSRCDYTTYQEKAALGHDIVKHDAKAATCTEIGWDAYETCSRCDYSTYKEKAALGHDIVKHDAKAPTCTEIGWDAYETCSRCDYTTYEEKAALGHSYDSAITKEAACTEGGVRTYHCIRCDDSYTEEIPALGHNYEVHEIPATVTVSGWTEKVCSRCGDSEITAVHTAPAKLEETAAEIIALDTNEKQILDASYNENDRRLTVEIKTDGFATDDEALGEVFRTMCLAIDCTNGLKEKTELPQSLTVEGVTVIENGEIVSENLTSLLRSLADKAKKQLDTSDAAILTVTLRCAADNGSGNEEFTVSLQPTGDNAVLFTKTLRRVFSSVSVTKTNEKTTVIIKAPDSLMEMYDKRRSVHYMLMNDRFQDVLSVMGLIDKASFPAAYGKDLFDLIEKLGANTDRLNQTLDSEIESVTVNGEGLLNPGAYFETVTDISSIAGELRANLSRSFLPNKLSRYLQEDGTFLLPIEIARYVGDTDETVTEYVDLILTVNDKYLQHSAAVLPAKAPTCTETGLTEGSRCTVCRNTVIAQETVSALGHDYIDHPAKAPACTGIGWNAYQTCTRCDFTSYEELPALGHAEVIDEAIAPTCTETGLTQGTHCDRCKEILTAQETVPALGHNWGAWAITTQPKCTEDGVETKTCERCDLQETRAVEALGHDYKETVTPPTCTVPGHTDHICERCGDSYTDSIVPALGHTEKEAVKENEIAPSCTETGSYDSVIYCAVCDAELKRTTVTVEALGHAFGAWETTAAPTCTEQGEETRTCARCGESETRPLNANGHTPKDPVKENTVAPSCTQNGSYDTAIYCAVCGAELERQTVIQNALGHNYSEWIEITPAKCETTGRETRLCTRCGTSENREIPAMGHDYTKTVTAPTCTETGHTLHTCSRCSSAYTDSEVPALGHAFGDWATVTPPSCTEKGKEKSVCSRCNTVENRETDALGHTPGEPVKENEVDPSCTEAGSYNTVVYCTVCGDEIERETVAVAALGHTPGEAVKENDVQPKCTEPGSYDMVVQCTVCKEEISRQTVIVDALGHDYKAAVTAPTCTDMGYTTFTCERCGDTYRANETAALGHTYGEWIVAAPATCTETGEKTRTCRVCGSAEAETLSALGHDYQNYVYDNNAACTEDGTETGKCTRCDATDTRPAAGTALGHSYSFTMWVWAEDKGNADVIFTCDTCGTTLTKSAEVTIRSTDAACETPGTTSYTASLTFEGETYTDTKTITGTALGHDYDAVVTASTCTEQGYTTHTCSRCGNSYDNAYTEPLGHDFGAWTVTTEPSCTKTGAETRYCARCEAAETREIAALGHDIVKHDAKAPTCTEIGWDAYETCARCDYSTYQEKDALGHDIVKHEAKAPTCTEIGWDAYETCARCDYSTYQEKDALGHDIVKHDAKAPNCTEIGWDAYDTCARCDYSTYQEKNALGHDIVKHEAKTPTCTEIGWDAYDTCARCDYSTYQEKDALGHDIVKHEAKAPTCTEIGWDAYETCARCDYSTYEEKDAQGHTPEVLPAVGSTCTESGLTAGYICSLCGQILIAQTETPALGHNFGAWTVTTEPSCTETGAETRTCARCHGTETRAVAATGHAYSAVVTPPTCTEDGYTTYTCERCGDSYEDSTVSALGHTEKAAVKENEIAPSCTKNGNYDSVTYCAVCGAELRRTTVSVDALGHAYTAAVTEPTCTEGGYSTYTCSRCGDSYTAEETEALGHAWSEWTMTVSPTCTEAGSEQRICARCDAAETRTADALGHILVKTEAKVPTTEEEGNIEYYTCTRCCKLFRDAATEHEISIEETVRPKIEVKLIELTEDDFYIPNRVILRNCGIEFYGTDDFGYVDTSTTEEIVIPTAKAREADITYCFNGKEDEPAKSGYYHLTAKVKESNGYAGREIDLGEIVILATDENMRVVLPNPQVIIINLFDADATDTTGFFNLITTEGKERILDKQEETGDTFGKYLTNGTQGIFELDSDLLQFTASDENEERFMFRRIVFRLNPAYGFAERLAQLHDKDGNITFEIEYDESSSVLDILIRGDNDTKLYNALQGTGLKSALLGYGFANGCRVPSNQFSTPLFIPDASDKFGIENFIELIICDTQLTGINSTDFKTVTLAELSGSIDLLYSLYDLPADADINTKLEEYNKLCDVLTVNISFCCE